MASLLFKCLKDKATNDETKDKIIYIDKDFKEYSYKDLYDLVCPKIDEFNKHKMFGNKRYLLTLNDIYSISSLIALLETDYSPIIIDGNQYLIVNEQPLKDKIILNNIQDSFILTDHQISKFDNKVLYDSLWNKSYIFKKANPSNRCIGVHTSGSGYEPKTIFIDENVLINKVFESKYVNEDRIIYNVAPLSSISGVFTNVFVPIISDNTKCILNKDFDVNNAIQATHVYLPRNYSDIFSYENRIENDINIKRIFTFGEQNSKAMFNYIRSKLLLPDNVFVNVYGTTECGGLVSEIEEKDLTELHVYFCGLQNDSLIYSFDDISFYYKRGNYVRKLAKEEISEYPISSFTSYLPCGFTNSKITIDGRKCVGDCVVDGYETGDIVANVDDKYYIIGRKRNLIQNRNLANYDNELTALINRTCATITDKNNELHLIIRWSIDDNENPLKDHTRYFRDLVKESKSIIEKVREHYPMINYIEFLSSIFFTLSNGLKKVNRQNLFFFHEFAVELRTKIDHFDELFKEYINRAFINNLGYVPNYYIDDEYNIRINKNDISLEQIVDLFNDLNIVFFYEENGYYKIIYNDKIFFDSAYRHNYKQIELDYYKRYAKSNLLQEKLAADKKIATFNIETEYPKIYDDFVENYVFSKVGIDNNGNTIIIPYYSIEPDKHFSELRNSEEKRNAEKRILDILNKYYAHINFVDHEMYVPFKKCVENTRDSFIGDFINLNEHEINYAHDVIKRAYLYKEKHNDYLDRIMTL